MKKKITLMLSLVLIALLLFPAAVFAEGEEPPAEDPPTLEPPVEEPPAEEPPAQEPPLDDLGGESLMAESLMVPMAPGGQAGTTLSVPEGDPTVQAYWEIVYEWTIDKSVDVDYYEFVPGDSGTSTYTIVVTKSAGTESAWIEGGVSVTNGGERATEGLAIMAVLRNGTSQNDPVVSNTPVDVSGNPVLDPSETGYYAFTIIIPPAYWIPNWDYRVDTDITILNHSGSLGVPKGPSPGATGKLPSAPTKVNDTIHVDDTNGGSWEFSASGSVSYDRTFTYDDCGVLTNRATIRETGLFDEAVVTVVCFEPHGDTFTIGFWKNHSGLGNGNQQDLISQYLPISLGSINVTTVQQAVDILSNMGSNGINKLMAQMLATKLNIANGAPVTPKLTAALTAADDFLMTYDADDWSGLSKAQQKNVLGWMSKFDDFNNGY